MVGQDYGQVPNSTLPPHNELIPEIQMMETQETESSLDALVYQIPGSAPLTNWTTKDLPLLFSLE